MAQDLPTSAAETAPGLAPAPPRDHGGRSSSPGRSAFSSAADPALSRTLRVNPSAVLARALPLGLVLCVLLAVPFLLHYQTQVARTRAQMQANEERVVELATQTILQEVSAVLSDLRLLSAQSEVRELLREDSPHNRDRLAAELLAFLTQKPGYDQARIIGSDGREQVRVNAHDGRPAVVPASRLQHKGDRYYVQEALRLGPGAIHVSPLDLNVEHGALELPPKPVLRASIPLFTAGDQRRGILTLNLLGAQILDRLEAIVQTGASKLWLLNAQGYWLMGPEPDLEWAFMHPDGANQTLAARHPAAWARIASEVADTVEIEAGLLTFRRVYPLAPDVPTARARGLATPASPQAYFWTVATFLPHAALQARRTALARDLALAYGTLALLTLLVSGWLTYLSARSRALLRIMASVLDNVPDLISYVDSDQRYRFSNRAYHRLFGLGPEGIHGRTIRDLIGEPAYRSVRPHIEKALAGAQVSFETRLEYSRAGPRDVSVTYVPDRGPGGEVEGVFVVVNDITRVKEAERRERERMLEVAHAARLASVGEMATQIAHEVNQPLTAIVTYCAALQRSLEGGSADPARLRDWVGAISDEARRVSEIVRRLREFVRRGEMTLTPVDLSEIVEEVVGMVEHEARRKAVPVVVEAAAGLPVALADRVLITQAVLNLVRNAVDAVAGQPAATCRVSVRAVAVGERVEVQVADTGPGVTADVRGQLFESFVSTKADGLGMGLSISRSIVEAHSGEIRYASAPEGGSLFTVSLPRARA